MNVVSISLCRVKVCINSCCECISLLPSCRHSCAASFSNPLASTKLPPVSFQQSSNCTWLCKHTPDSLLRTTSVTASINMLYDLRISCINSPYHPFLCDKHPAARFKQMFLLHRRRCQTMFSLTIFRLLPTPGSGLLFLFLLFGWSNLSLLSLEFLRNAGNAAAPEKCPVKLSLPNNKHESVAFSDLPGRWPPRHAQ